MTIITLLPHITKPTRITNHTNTFIDNIFLNSFECETISGNLISDLLDHLQNFLIANNLPMCKERSNLLIRDYSNFDKDSFQLSFELVNWKHVLENKSINDIFNSFFTTTSDIVNQFKEGIKERNQI